MKLLEEPPVAPVEAPRRDRQNMASIADPLPQLMQLFRLLADETRLRILRLFFEGDEYHVRALCEHLGQSQPAVSHHLALLRSAGLIECRRQGKHNFYRLTPQKFDELLDLVFAGKLAADRRIRLGKYVLSCDE